MVTEVMMQRELFGMPIRQKSKSEFLSVTDLVKAGNKFRIMAGKAAFNLDQYFKNSSTVEFIEELERRNREPVKVSIKGRNGQTWVHPFLFLDVALHIDPALKVEVYSWLMDHLLAYRNDSGDSYKKMAGALYAISSNKAGFPKLIVEVCKQIQAECNCADWNKATEAQLKLRDKIHENIYLLSDVLKDIKSVVSVAIRKAIA